MQSEVAQNISMPPLARSKMLVMYIATGGLWSPWWFHRAGQTIRQATGSSAYPVAETLRFAALPFVTVALAAGTRTHEVRTWHLAEHPWAVLAYWAVAAVGCVVAVPAVYRLFGAELSEMRDAAGGLIYVRDPALSTAAFVLFWLGWLLPNPFRFLGLLGVLPLLKVQLAINQYLDCLDVQLPEESRFSRWEMIAAVVCGAFLLWALGGALKDFVDSFSPTVGPPGS